MVGEDETGRVVGMAAIEPRGDVGLLRSVVVSPDVRGHSLGRRLVRYMIDHARHLGLKKLFLLTTTAEDWFAGVGFVRIDRGGVPEALKASAEFSGACPDTATVMVLHRLDS